MFEVLAMPCNQFGMQEPGKNSEILNGLKYVRPGEEFEPAFPVFGKLDVNGDTEHPLYTHLKSVCPHVKLEIGDKSKLFWSNIKVGDITWNFEKFLVRGDGLPYKRYDPGVEPTDMRDDIDALIAQEKQRNNKVKRQIFWDFLNSRDN